MLMTNSIGNIKFLTDTSLVLLMDGPLDGVAMVKNLPQVLLIASRLARCDIAGTIEWVRLKFNNP